MKLRRPRPLDVLCPACGAMPWERCRPYRSPNGFDVPGGRSHQRRSALARRLATELGWPKRRLYGAARKAAA